MPTVKEVHNVSIFDEHNWERPLNGLLHGKRVIGTCRKAFPGNPYKYDLVHLSVPTTLEKAAYTTVSVLGGLAIGLAAVSHFIIH